MATTNDDGVRLAELLAALSLGIDLGFGQPMEHVLRQSIIALRLADRLGLDDHERYVLYNASLLVNVACHTDAHEQAKWMGDDIEMKSQKYSPHGVNGVRAAVASVRMIGAGQPILKRFGLTTQFARYGWRDLQKMIDGHASMARAFAAELGLPDDVVEAVGSMYEQWDGKGWPAKVSGEDVPLAARISQLAEFVEAAHRAGGVPAATALARKQRGKQFDPKLADMVCADAEALLAGLEDANAWSIVIDGEPSLTRTLTADEFDGALIAIANFVDLKSPYFLGHSTAVADLVEQAARHVGMTPSETRTLKRAALVLGFGRLGVSNAIWDKPGPLGTGEMERVRLHPYLAERMLRQSPTLAKLSAIAVQYRERLDGSGYPAGLTGAAIARPARLLAAADVYQSLREPRPYRPGHDPEAAAMELRAEVKAGRLDGDAVDAVLTVAGHRVSKRREDVAGLTAREIEVLRLVARGMTNKAIAQELTISPKTAGNHVEHIYTKIGATSRSAASLFAMQHGLLNTD